jgi:RHS repeat-associated protein
MKNMKILTGIFIIGLCGATAYAGFPWNYAPPPPPCQECPCPPGSGGAGGSSGGGAGGGGGFGGFGGGGCSTCSVNHPTAGASSSTGGMPDWKVNEPNIDLRLHDEPLAYQSSVSRVSFQIDYWQRDDRVPSTNVFTMGPNWECSWQAYIDTDGTTYDPVMLYGASGGEIEFDDLTGATPSYYQNLRMLSLTDTNGNLSGFGVFYPSGAEDVYGFCATNTSGVVSQAYLSKKVDASGHATTFVYAPFNPATGVVQLNYVIDPDGKTNTLSYTNNASYNCLISQVQDPFGHTVHFAYDASGNLTNVTDVAGLSSSFGYGSFAGSYIWANFWDGYEWYVDYVYNPTNTWLNQLTTPYGTTTFGFTDDSLEDYDVVNRSAIVTEPNGSHQMFVHRGYTSFIGDIANPNGVPSSTPDGSGLDDGWLMVYRNTFYWGRQQFANLSAGFLATGATNWDLTQLTSQDYMKARWQKWAHASDGGQSDALTMEQDPSPDGVNPGEMTWFTYPNQPEPYYQGSSALPTLTIKVLPDGSQWYRQFVPDQWGNFTNIIETYSSGGSVLTRTNTYVYSANGVDLLQTIRADGVTDAAYGYDVNHQVLFQTNALGEVTRYTYNTNEQLTSTTLPSGLVTTNIYGANSLLAQQIAIGFATNSYTYTNGLVYTHTDERGLTVTNSWDVLQRLTKVSYPDGTSESYTYNKLDLAKFVDRMGFATGYGYNAIRQKVVETNTLGNVTSYSYCDCGALESFTDPLGNATQYAHDNQGNLVGASYPDGYSITNQYNLLRQLVQQKDSFGAFFNCTYNNQGLLTTISNAAGQVAAYVYDIDDQVTNSVNANGITVNAAYDSLNRPLTRSYPNGGTENFGYTFNVPFPTSYTNEIGSVTLFGYDSMNRKTNEVDIGVTTNRLGYNSAGDLIALTDGRNQVTTWHYDSFGRVTNKVDALNRVAFNYAYDADNRLTNRWTPEKGNTFYSYDAADNVTQIRYPQFTNTYAYDALNHLTNMVDAVGTTHFTYDAVSHLLSEGGLWTSDTVGYTYSQGLRTVMSLNSQSFNYVYDAARRLQTLVAPAGSFGYQYPASQSSILVSQLLLPNGASISNSYDSMARLTQTALNNHWANALDSYSYGYDLLGERTNVTRNVGLTASTVSAGYDAIGQLTSWTAKETNGAPRLNEQLGWAYDAGNNLLRRTNGALVQTFAMDAVNELTNITRTGTLTASGATPAPATTVTVNGLVAQIYGDFTFARTNLTLANGNNSFTNIAQNVYGVAATNTTIAYLPTPVSLTYDANGNLTNDGLKTFGFNAENQLTNVAVAGQWKSDFVYDGLNRRRIARDYSWSGSAWVKTNETRYIYDGYLIIQERDTNNSPLVTYTRGIDLSGCLHGVGGIGSLLARTDGNGSAFYHADANGNITALIDGNENIVARYLYNPFGKLTGQWGSLANANVMQFSSKPKYRGLYDFGLRWYALDSDRFLNQDPIGEHGGLNLYAYVANDPVGKIDPLGLEPGYGNPVSGPNGPVGPSTPTGPSLPPPNVNPLLPGPGQVPPGYNPSWPSGIDSYGRPFTEDPNTGIRYYPHQEDVGHWPHYDDSNGNRYPKNCFKPRPGQKKPPYGNQSPKNPWPEPAPEPEPTPTPPVVEPAPMEPELPELPEIPFFDI